MQLSDRILVKNMQGPGFYPQHHKNKFSLAYPEKTKPNKHPPPKKNLPNLCLLGSPSLLWNTNEGLECYSRIAEPLTV